MSVVLHFILYSQNEQLKLKSSWPEKLLIFRVIFNTTFEDELERKELTTSVSSSLKQVHTPVKIIRAWSWRQDLDLYSVSVVEWYGIAKFQWN